MKYLRQHNCGSADCNHITSSLAITDSLQSVSYSSLSGAIGSRNRHYGLYRDWLVVSYVRYDKNLRQALWIGRIVAAIHVIRPQSYHTCDLRSWMAALICFMNFEDGIKCNLNWALLALVCICTMHMFLILINWCLGFLLSLDCSYIWLC